MLIVWDSLDSSYSTSDSYNFKLGKIIESLNSGKVVDFATVDILRYSSPDV